MAHSDGFSRLEAEVEAIQKRRELVRSNVFSGLLLLSLAAAFSPVYKISDSAWFFPVAFIVLGTVMLVTGLTQSRDVVDRVTGVTLLIVAALVLVSGIYLAGQSDLDNPWPLLLLFPVLYLAYYGWELAGFL